MNKEMRRRICALISSYIVLIGCYLSSCHKNDVAYNQNYEYKSEEPYAYFRDGKVYICNSRTIERIREANPTIIPTNPFLCPEKAARAIKANTITSTIIIISPFIYLICIFYL